MVLFKPLIVANMHLLMTLPVSLIVNAATLSTKLLPALIVSTVSLLFFYLLSFVIDVIVTLFFVLIKKTAFRTLLPMMKSRLLLKVITFIPTVFICSMLSLDLYLFAAAGFLIIVGILLLFFKKEFKK